MLFDVSGLHFDPMTLLWRPTGILKMRSTGHAVQSYGLETQTATQTETQTCVKSLPTRSRGR